MIVNQAFYIGEVPAILYGEKADKVFLFIHGKCGCKEEARQFAEIACQHNYQVLSIDMPEHGKRQDDKQLLPWDVVPEFKKVMNYIQQRWHNISLRANSIGAWFSMQSFQDIRFEKCLFVSPILDMEKLIDDMMRWAGVSIEMLEAQGEIHTEFGETLSWKYYNYAKENIIETWQSNTYILYADKDNMTPLQVVEDFVEKHHCQLRIMKNGEHWFHTEPQLAYLNEWVQDTLYDN